MQTLREQHVTGLILERGREPQCGRAAEEECAVLSCGALVNGAPFCDRHLTKIEPRVARHLEWLEFGGAQCQVAGDGTAYLVYVGLVAEQLERKQCDNVVPGSHSQRRHTGAARAKTLETVRAHARHRWQDRYGHLVAEEMQRLAELQTATGAASALQVAQLMISRGIGVDGFDPLLIAAALELDEVRQG